MKKLFLYLAFKIGGLFFLLICFSDCREIYMEQGNTLSTPKKLIATGWDFVDNTRLAYNLEQIKSRPFDGLIMGIQGSKRDGAAVDLRIAFNNERWDSEWFQVAIDQINAVDLNPLTDNFILIQTRPADVDWFDDDGWRNIVEHWEIAAWIAHQTGFKGIAFDQEPYDERIWNYFSQQNFDEHTFEEYYEIARQRGREVMESVASQYPDITLLCYRMNSVNKRSARQTESHTILYALEPKHGYSLYPGFIDGWLDSAPPTVTFVDGGEDAYYFNNEQEFLQQAHDIKKNCLSLVSPENHSKYRNQVQVGFGIYLDAYTPEARRYVEGLNLRRLRANLASASRIAAEYIWIYGEDFSWWPSPDTKVSRTTWPEILPGCEEELDYIRNPVAFAENQVMEATEIGTSPNLLFNGNFKEEILLPDGTIGSFSEEGPVGWSSWEMPYYLRLEQVDVIEDLIDEGRNELIIALVGDVEKLYIGIFDAAGSLIVNEIIDEGEGDLDPGIVDAVAELRSMLSPFRNVDDLLWEERKAILNTAMIIVGHSLEDATRWDEENRGADDSGSARIIGLCQGCFIQEYSVLSGQRYAISAARRIQGRGMAYVRIRYKNEAGFTQESLDPFFFFPGSGEEWREDEKLFGVFEVLEGVSELAINLCVADQRSELDIVWFDDVELSLLEFP